MISGLVIPFNFLGLLFRDGESSFRRLVYHAYLKITFITVTQLSRSFPLLFVIHRLSPQCNHFIDPSQVFRKTRVAISSTVTHCHQIRYRGRCFHWTFLDTHCTSHRAKKHFASKQVRAFQSIRLTVLVPRLQASFKLQQQLALNLVCYQRLLTLEQLLL